MTSVTIINLYHKCKPVPVTARSKALVCGRSPAETAGSNPDGDVNVCMLLSVVCCQVEVSATS